MLKTETSCGKCTNIMQKVHNHYAQKCHAQNTELSCKMQKCYAESVEKLCSKCRNVTLKV